MNEITLEQYHKNFTGFSIHTKQGFANSENCIYDNKGYKYTFVRTEKVLQPKNRWMYSNFEIHYYKRENSGFKINFDFEMVEYLPLGELHMLEVQNGLFIFEY